MERSAEHIDLLQQTFGLTPEEFGVLAGERDAERQALLSELSRQVGQLPPDERKAFFREETPIGVWPPGSPYVRTRIPLEVVAEPNGLARITAAAKREVGRRLRASRGQATGRPENK